jgi:hypothetical protein
VFVVSWIGADARDHRLARLSVGRAAAPEHLSVALIDNVRESCRLIEGEAVRKVSPVSVQRLPGDTAQSWRSRK